MLGIEVRIDRSWLVIAALVSFSMYRLFNFRFDLGQVATVSIAIVFALLFFSSVLIHELAHAVVARRRGIEVRGITLFLFGGATHAKVDSRRPQDELVVSVVGPLTSLILGGVFLLLARVIGWPARPAAWGFGYLGGVNVALAVFNMLPGFPLDGGRVLRAVLWRATGSFRRATAIAGVAGRIVGYLLVLGGVLLVGTERVGAGLWIAAIGWFLAQAAGASAEEGRGRADQTEREELQGTPEAAEGHSTEGSAVSRADET